MWTSVNLRDTLQPSYLTFDTQELSTASWQAQKCTPPVHKSPGILPLVWSLGLSGLITQPSSVSTRTWFHLHKDIGLDCQHCGAWNKNEIGYWLVSFPGSRVPYKSLGTRLAVDQRHTISDTFPSVFAYCKWTETPWREGLGTRQQLCVHLLQTYSRSQTALLALESSLHSSAVFVIATHSTSHIVHCSYSIARSGHCADWSVVKLW